jgi:hypothetical protein
MRRPFTVAAAFVFAALLAPGRAEGDDPPLDSNTFVIDTYSGLQIGSIRTTTLGGAYTGIAERSQGIMYNPAAVAQRVWYSQYLFDWDIGYAYQKPGLIFKDTMDIDNDGKANFKYRDYMIGIVYAALRVGKVGGGTVVRLQRFVLAKQGEKILPAFLGHADVAAGLNMWEDRIVLGAGMRLVFMDISVRGVEQGNGLTYMSAGFVGGLLFRFKRIPLRVGLSTALPVPGVKHGWTSGVVTCSTPSAGDIRKIGVTDACGGEGLIIPEGISFPWSVRLGFAYYIGKLPWNETWKLEKREYETSNLVPTKRGKLQWSPWQSEYMLERQEIDRRYVMFSLDVEVVGGVRNGIGLEGFLSQTWKKSFGSPTVSVHAGIETEVVADWLVLRAGGYAEPSRFTRLGYRGHGTFGLDLKLFSICHGSSRLTFRGSAGFDAARDYFNAGFSLGFWK